MNVPWIFSSSIRWGTPRMAMWLTASFLLVTAGTAASSQRALAVEDVEAKLQEAMSAEDHARVVELTTEALRSESAPSVLWYWRARSHFCLGKIKESVEDFDRYVKLRPEQKSRQWERGIALYYAGEYEKGARQFELYQTYHDNDVENSVWRFLCLVPKVGLEKARQTMLPIRDDRRVPMMQIYKVYRGEGTVDQVWEAVEAGAPTPEQLAGRRFYAQLYLGLFHEARGEAEQAKRHLKAAADEHKETRQVNRYMWQVARVHASRWE